MRRYGSMVFRFPVLFLIAALFLASCATEPRQTGQVSSSMGGTESSSPSSDEAGSEQKFRYGEAEIESLSFQVLESNPLRVEAIIEGFLSDGCTMIDRIRIRQEENSFRITVRTRRPVDAVCTQALKPFVERMELPLEGVPTGTYRIVAGDVQKRFVLE